MNSRSSKPQPTLVDSATAATYDGRGQRVSKTVDGVTTHFIYGLNGELMGEYTTDGNSSKEYVYLNGQPIAAVIAETQAATPEDFWMDTDFENPWSGITHTGEWWYGSSPENHIHGHHRSTGAGTYRFTPALTAGTYEVYVWWVDVTIRGGATSVPYSINHNGSIDIEYRNQTSGGGQWQLLGTFEFHGRGAEYVEVDAVNGITTADAVRFVQIPAGEETSVETFYIHTDHLGAPRAMSDELQTVVWRWDSAPFGNSPVDEDPDGDGTAVTLNLRFPGQYFHAESGLHYNYFRTYDPEIGRYVEADPLGFVGGANLFAYVLNRPIGLGDRFGLFPLDDAWDEEPPLMSRLPDREPIMEYFCRQFVICPPPQTGRPEVDCRENCYNFRSACVGLAGPVGTATGFGFSGICNLATIALTRGFVRVNPACGAFGTIAIAPIAAARTLAACSVWTENCLASCSSSCPADE